MERRALLEHQAAALHVAMAAAILRCGMHHHIRAEIQRPLQRRRGKRVVHRQIGSGLACGLRDRGDIHNFHLRIGWRLGPNDFGIRANGSGNRGERLCVHACEFELPIREIGGGEDSNVHVNIFRNDYVRVRLQGLKESRRGAHTRGKHQGILAAFESAHRGFQAILRRIFVPHIHVPVNFFARRTMDKICGEMNRWRDTSRDRIGCKPGMNGHSFHFHEK